MEQIRHDEPAYWFVFCKDELLLQRSEGGLLTVPFGKEPPVELADWNTVHRLTPLGGKACRAVSIDRPVVEDAARRMVGLRASFDILPRDRRLAMAFQNYTLYRHFNAYDNIALGLRLRDLPRTVIDSRVKMAAKFFGLTDLLDRKIRSLSDADNQRVALSRAVVCQPKVLLVDEDFARQDDARRIEMLADIQAINREYHITVLYVTNKYDEVVDLGKKTVFMKDGKITDIRQ